MNFEFVNFKNKFFFRKSYKFIIYKYIFWVIYDLHLIEYITMNEDDFKSKTNKNSNIIKYIQLLKGFYDLITIFYSFL